MPDGFLMSHDGTASLVGSLYLQMVFSGLTKILVVTVESFFESASNLLRPQNILFVGISHVFESHVAVTGRGSPSVRNALDGSDLSGF